MSCSPKGLAALATNYILDHEEELTEKEEPLNYDEFEELRKELTLELEAAIVDRWIEWRDKQNEEGAS